MIMRSEAQMAMSSEPRAPNMRSFKLNSDEAYAALCPRAERPWIANGALPREPKWPRGESSVWVAAENEAEAGEAFKAWLGHVEAGRIG